MPTAATMSELLDRYAGILLDVYGVLLDGSGILPGARELIGELERRGKPYAIVTNDASRSIPTYVQRFARLGLPIPGERIVTSGSLLPGYLRAKSLAGARVCVLGTDDSVDYVREGGGVPVPLARGLDCDALAVCDDSGFAQLPLRIQTQDTVCAGRIHLGIYRRVGGVGTLGIARADDPPAGNARPSHQIGVDVGPVIPPTAAVDLGGASEFAGNDQQGALVETAVAQVLDEGGTGAVEHGELMVLQAGEIVRVVVEAPILDWVLRPVYLDESYPCFDQPPSEQTSLSERRSPVALAHGFRLSTQVEGLFGLPRGGQGDGALVGRAVAADCVGLHHALEPVQALI